MPAPLNGFSHSQSCSTMRPIAAYRPALAFASPSFVPHSSISKGGGQISPLVSADNVQSRLIARPSPLLSHHRDTLGNGDLQEPVLWGKPLLRLSSLAQQSRRGADISMRAANSDELEPTEIGEGGSKATGINGDSSGFDADVIDRLKSFVADPSKPFSSEDYSCYLNYYGLDVVTEGVERHFDSLSVGDDNIAMQSFIQPEGQSTGDIICVHGYHDHAGVYTDIVSNAVKQGKNIYLFDFQGHGLSTASMGPCGVRSYSKYSDALDAVMEKVAERRGADIAAKVDFIAHSTGGCVVSSRLLSGANNRAVLLGPLFKNGNFDRSKRAYDLAMKAAEKRNIPIDSVSKPSVAVGVDTTNKVYAEFAQRDPLRGKIFTASWFGSLLEWQQLFSEKAPNGDVKPLILQGDQDAVVDGPYNKEKFLEKFQEADFHLLEGVGHQIMNERPEVVERVNQMINDYLS